MPVTGQLDIPFARGSHTSFKAARRVDPVQRQTKTRRYLPFQGSTPRARHCSADGARIAVRCRAKLQRRYLLALAHLGPLSDHEASDLLGVGLSSINSTRGALMPKQSEDDPYPVQFVADAEEWVKNPKSGAKNERWIITSEGRNALCL